MTLFKQEELVYVSYHDKDKCIKDGYFQSAAKGQEFAFSESKVVTEWAKKIILDS